MVTSQTAVTIPLFRLWNSRNILEIFLFLFLFIFEPVGIYGPLYVQCTTALTIAAEHGIAVLELLY